jgi:hypothetical protein
MTRDEFKTWFEDFRARFPETGLWMSKLPKATRDLWFNDYFSSLDLRDCLAVNHHLMETPEALEAYNREKLPGVFLKRCQEVSYDRQHRESRHGLSRDAEVYAGKEHFDTSMGKILRMVEARQREHLEKTGERMSDAERKVLVDELFAEYDTSDDRSGPRYRCHLCRDTGLCSYDDHKGRQIVGHCRCELGDKKRTSFEKNKKRLGPAMQFATTNPEDNDFNNAEF